MPAAFCHIYAQFDQVGDRLPEDWEHLARLGLVADVAVSLAQAERQRAALAQVRAAGGLVALTWYPRDADAGAVDPNWWTYPAAECRRLVEVGKQRFAALGLGPLDALNTYTPGNPLVEACRGAGIGYLLGYCAPIVIEDGGWKIAHYGSPLSPYFISGEDYRKPEDPGARTDAVLMASMELRNPLVCLRHWSEGPWCPLNAQAADRWLEPSDRPWPFIQIAEDWLRQGELDGGQRFFHINLQYFFAGANRGHNRRALEWLALQRDRGRLAVGSLRDWGRGLRAAGGFVPQATTWRGEMPGFHVGNRAGFFPDTVVDESLARQVVFEEGIAAPQRLYDYRRPWACHPFKPDGSDPASAACDGLTLRCTRVADEAAARRLRIEVGNQGDQRSVPLVAWGALDGLSAPFAVEGARVLPHPSGCGGQLLVERAWPPGATTIELTVRHGGAAAVRHRRRWGGLIEAQTFTVDHRPCTVLAIQAPACATLTLRPARAGLAGARVESLVGIDHEERPLAAAGVPLRFDGSRLACWHRVWDRHADEIELDGVEEAEAQLRAATAALAGGTAVPAPGYQRHGALADPQRWDLAAGRAAGAAEQARVEARWRELHPAAGPAVIAVHPGRDLPCGSITKVLGHRFDRIDCAPGYGFEELCADYPQAWAPGVAAWVQWRHLNVALEGLCAGAAPFTLHLHACDPECRGLVQRVHLFDPDAADGERVELCVVRGWDAPQGLDARFDRAAFCSVRIPGQCLAWKRIGVWISPCERMKLHDWVAERGAPGLFMHLWVTSDRA